MSNKITSLTGLRFIMIIAVVICHLDYLSDIEPFGHYYDKYWSYQILSVDFFFMLSGFGMMLSSIRRIPDSEMKWPTLKEGLHFGINHVKRIYPTYIITMAIGLAAFITISIYHELPAREVFIRNIPRVVLSVPLLQSTTGISNFSQSYNAVAWFLSTMFCIYLISPWLIYTLRKMSKTIKSDIIILIIDVLFIVVLAYLFEKVETFARNTEIAQRYGFTNFKLVYESPYRRVFYVLMGMSLAMIFYRQKNKGIQLNKEIANTLEISISLVVLFYYLLRNSIPSGDYRYAIDVIICAATIFIFAFSEGKISDFLSRPSMQKLGNMSMYIYLIHFPIIYYGDKIINHYYGRSVSMSILFTIAVFVSTFVISDWIYKKQYQNHTKEIQQ